MDVARQTLAPCEDGIALGSNCPSGGRDSLSAHPRSRTQGDDPEPALLAVCDGGGLESSSREDDCETGSAHAGTGLVAAVVGKEPEPVPQLQCSRKPPRLQRLNPHESSLPTTWSRLSARCGSLSSCRTRSKEWSQWSGLNRRPTVYETVALPLSYIGVQRLTKVVASLTCIPAQEATQATSPLRR